MAGFAGDVARSVDNFAGFDDNLAGSDAQRNDDYGFGFGFGFDDRNSSSDPDFGVDDMPACGPCSGPEPGNYADFGSGSYAGYNCYSFEWIYGHWAVQTGHLADHTDLQADQTGPESTWESHSADCDHKW